MTKLMKTNPKMKKISKNEDDLKMRIKILIGAVTLHNVFPYSDGILCLVAQFCIVDLVMHSLYF